MKSKNFKISKPVREQQPRDQFSGRCAKCGLGRMNFMYPCPVCPPKRKDGAPGVAGKDGRDGKGGRDGKDKTRDPDYKSITLLSVILLLIAAIFVLLEKLVNNH